ncbi:MAG: hypothetical protein JWN04_6487 [Myxococcaceae bacterium]|nr:hypothetical protein [Myxococcaceae bacterium]
MDPLALSTELALVRETRACRKCQWLWGPDKPYGPFPSYDFNEPAPGAVRRRLPLASGPQPWLKAVSTGAAQIDPALLHGCRKAPIMTLGINPNMGGFFSTPEGASFVYPHFSEDARYAYYYRHRQIYQERVDAHTIDGWLATDQRIEAEAAGTVLEVKRSQSHRWLQIKVRYDDAREQTHELAWRERQLVAVLVRVHESFAKGRVLAGLLAPAEGQELTLWATPVGYYERFERVLERLQKLQGWPTPPLLGEDVSQGDLVACATPGWSGDALDLPTDRLAQSCAREQAFALRQVLQSAPSVLVFSGRSALRMFASALPEHTWLAEWSRLAPFALLRECTARPRYLRLERPDFRFETRILCAPHFSYGDGFEPGSRFSEVDWQHFVSDHPGDAARLLVTGMAKHGEGEVQVALDPSAPAPTGMLPLTESASRALRAAHCDPVGLLASALAEEIQHGRITRDPDSGRLQRAAGGCDFCHNSQWRFPEGCSYPETHAAPTLTDASSKALSAELTRSPPGGWPIEAVRLWRGRRRAELSADDFARQLRTLFIPATVRTMQPLGLVAYLPSLLAENGTASLPSEIALVAYGSRSAYESARESELGRAYGALHGSLFEFADNASYSEFVSLWHDEPLQRDRAYSLFEDEVDWQRGVTLTHFAALVDESALAGLSEFLSTLRRARPPGLRAYVFMVVGQWFFRWAHFGDVADVRPIQEPMLRAPVLSGSAKDWPCPSDNNCPTIEAPLHGQQTLNVLFARR